MTEKFNGAKWRNQAKMGKKEKLIPVTPRFLAALTKALFAEGKPGTRLCLQQTFRFSWYFLVS